MARAKIVSEQGGGRYVIQIAYDISRAEQRMNSLGAQISGINQIIATLEYALSSLENDHRNAIDGMNHAIDDANANNDNNTDFSAAYLKILSKSTKKITDININMVKTSELIALNINKISAKKIELKGVNDSFTKYKNPLNQTAWCADYTERLAGDVGIICINDETNAPNDQQFIIGAAGTTIDDDLLVSLQADLSTLQVQLSFLQADINALQISVAQQLAVIYEDIRLINKNIYDLNEQLQFLIANKLDTSFKESQISQKTAEITIKNNEVSALVGSITAKNGELIAKQQQINGKIGQINSNGNQEIQPAISSGAMAIAYNLCAMPAFQKWSPRYKTAIISNIDKVNDTCKISFTQEHQKSSLKSYTQDTYNIVQEQTIDNVPVDYMTCNASAFETGDRVIVNFNSDWATPKVMGFLDNPRRCGGYVLCSPSSTAGAIGRKQIEFNGNSARSSDADGQAGGNVYWTDGGRIISWHGSFGFNLNAVPQIGDNSAAFLTAGYIQSEITVTPVGSGEVSHANRFSNTIFSGGVPILIEPSFKIIGAGYYQDVLLVAIDRPSGIEFYTIREGVRALIGIASRPTAGENRTVITGCSGVSFSKDGRAASLIGYVATVDGTNKFIETYVMRVSMLPSSENASFSFSNSVPHHARVMQHKSHVVAHSDIHEIRPEPWKIRREVHQTINTTTTLSSSGESDIAIGYIDDVEVLMTQKYNLISGSTTLSRIANDVKVYVDDQEGHRDLDFNQYHDINIELETLENGIKKRSDTVEKRSLAETQIFTYTYNSATFVFTFQGSASKNSYSEICRLSWVFIDIANKNHVNVKLTDITISIVNTVSSANNSPLAITYGDYEQSLSSYLSVFENDTTLIERGFFLPSPLVPYVTNPDDGFYPPGSPLDTINTSNQNITIDSPHLTYNPALLQPKIIATSIPDGVVGTIVIETRDSLTATPVNEYINIIPHSSIDALFPLVVGGEERQLGTSSYAGAVALV